VLRKATYHAEAVGPLGRLGIGGLDGPLQRQLRGDEVSVFALGEVDEPLQ
jgi:hypothetical protein